MIELNMSNKSGANGRRLFQCTVGVMATRETRVTHGSVTGFSVYKSQTVLVSRLYRITHESVLVTGFAFYVVLYASAYCNSS